MAARTRKIRHDEETRAKIQVSQLVNVLQNDALGRVPITDGRRRSAEILLRKRLPDLAAIDHTGDVQQSYIVRMPAVVADLGAWRAEQDDKPPTSPNDVNGLDTTKH